MNILFTGATGFIGYPLTCRLLELGHSIHVLTRSTEKAQALFGEMLAHYPQQLTFFNAIDNLPKSSAFDAIINLAGEGIANSLWTTAYKHTIWNSRVQLTQDLSHWIRESASPPPVMISASAIGYYGDQKERVVYEETKGAHGFSHELCRHWEQAALSASRYGCRVCCLRIGVVLAPDGGFIKKMTPLLKIGMGVLFGNGKQWLPWIHREDLIQIILTALDDSAYFSAINAVSPTPATLKTVSTAIGKQAGHPLWIRIPRWLMQPFIGEMTHLFFDSIKASSDRLIGFGYRHRFPTLEAALKDIFSTKTPPQP